MEKNRRRIGGFLFRIFVLLIISAMIISVLSTVVSAARGLDAFSDVKSDAWYYQDITEMTALKFINGYPDGTFRPNGRMTCAEFIKLITVVLEIYSPDEESTLPPIYINEAGGNEKHWANKYISAACCAGIIVGEDVWDGSFVYDKPITRSYMAKIIVRLLGLSTDIQNGRMFADDASVYAEAVAEEYIVLGYTSEYGREYRGYLFMTRAEAAAVVMRVRAYRENPKEYRTKAIIKNAENTTLTTKKELIDFFCAVNRKCPASFKFTSSFSYREWHDVYMLAQQLYPEYFMSTGFTCYYKDGYNVFNVELEYSSSVSDAARMMTVAETYAASIAPGIIDENADFVEKLRQIHDYIILNCKYDYENYKNGTIPRKSYTAYGVFAEGTAVCQGYSAAFSLLCAEAGIKTVSVVGTSPNGENHCWNMVYIGGKTYYIDPTFDDPVPDVEGSTKYEYFMLGAEEMRAKGYFWDENVFTADYVK